jgi:hypothetical protein
VKITLLCKLLICRVLGAGGESGIRTYAAVEKRSASLSQSATRFHLGKIWATISKLLILKA